MVLPELGQPNHAQHREYQILTKLVHLNQPVGEVECDFTHLHPFDIIPAQFQNGTILLNPFSTSSIVAYFIVS